VNDVAKWGLDLSGTYEEFHEVYRDLVRRDVPPFTPRETIEEYTRQASDAIESLRVAVPGLMARSFAEHGEGLVVTTLHAEPGLFAQLDGGAKAELSSLPHAVLKNADSSKQIIFVTNLNPDFVKRYQAALNKEQRSHRLVIVVDNARELPRKTPKTVRAVAVSGQREPQLRDVIRRAFTWLGS
jgi:hypothetical protein